MVKLSKTGDKALKLHSKNHFLIAKIKFLKSIRGHNSVGNQQKMMAIYPVVHLVDSKVSAKFDDIPFMPLQNIKQKPKCHGRMDGQTDGQSKNILLVGV